MTANRPWRIAHSEASLGWGGQENRTLTELRAFRDRGAWVALLAPRHSEIYRRAADDGIPVSHLDVKKWRYPLNVFRVAHWLWKNKAQVVNTHSSRDGYLVGAAARLARVPLVIRSRHIDVSYPNPAVSRHAFTTFADHVITTSGKITDHLRETFQLDAKRISTVPTGIDVDLFTPEGPAADLFEAAVGKPKNLPVIAMVSVLRSWKGHPVFLEAAKNLVDRGRKARFVIVGEGPQREAIRSKIQELGLEEHVTLTGHREDVPEVLRAIDALAIPSTGHEGIPQIGLQALASRTAVVGSDAGGIPEIIHNGETGRIVPAGDAGALADAIDTLLMRPAETFQWSLKGREFVKSGHSLEHMVERLEEIYKAALP